MDLKRGEGSRETGCEPLLCLMQGRRKAQRLDGESPLVPALETQLFKIRGHSSKSYVKS